ncbi:unnamed protein product [Knipowitschia caucasica]
MLCVFTGPSAAEASRDPKELLLWTEDCRGVCAAVTQGPPEVPLPQGPPGASEHVLAAIVPSSTSRCGHLESQGCLHTSSGIVTCDITERDITERPVAGGGA